MLHEQTTQKNKKPKQQTHLAAAHKMIRELLRRDTGRNMCHKHLQVLWPFRKHARASGSGGVVPWIACQRRHAQERHSSKLRQVVVLADGSGGSTEFKTVHVRSSQRRCVVGGVRIATKEQNKSGQHSAHMTHAHIVTHFVVTNWATTHVGGT